MDFKGFEIIWHNLDYLIFGNFPGGIVLTLLMSFAAIVFSTILGVFAGVGLTVCDGFLRNCIRFFKSDSRYYAHILDLFFIASFIKY